MNTDQQITSDAPVFFRVFLRRFSVALFCDEER